MISERLHTLTHRVPEVPEHDAAHTSAHTAPQHSRTARGRGHQGRANRPHGHSREPRVLVRWQRWIASITPRGRARA